MKKMLLAGCLIFLGCGTQQNVYLKDIGQSEKITLEAEAAMPKITVGSNLSITVSGLDDVALMPYHARSNGQDKNDIKPQKPLPFQVDNEGDITFPNLGKIHLEGLTLNEAKKTIEARLQEHIKNPIVHVAFCDMYFTVLGYVYTPGTYRIDNAGTNLFEALAQAGDIASNGDCSNILVMRKSQTELLCERVDISKKEVFNSPYFFLQNNDIIYVSPKVKRSK